MYGEFLETRLNREILRLENKYKVVLTLEQKSNLRDGISLGGHKTYTWDYAVTTLENKFLFLLENYIPLASEA